MATKEVMVTAPILVLLYDRTFLAGSFAQALRRRWPLYLGLAATSALLGYLVLSTGLLGTTAGFAIPGAWDYLRMQPGAILRYLHLAIWPDPLCLEWGVVRDADGAAKLLVPALLISTVLAITVIGLVCRKDWAMLGVWFFVILAPTSLLPLRNAVYEHRMYLPLAAVLTTVVMGSYSAGVGLARRGWLPGRLGPVVATCLVTLVAVALGGLTFRRNQDYRSELSIWEDTLAKVPNAQAHYNMGVALYRCGRVAEAIEQYEQALRLKPEHALAHNNLGLALVDVGRTEEAIQHYRETLRITPNDAAAGNNLGQALASVGRFSEAIQQYRSALRRRPESFATYCNLGVALVQAGRTPEAVECYQQALRINPEYAAAHYNLAIRLAEGGHAAEAIAHYERALQIDPKYADARLNLGIVLASQDRLREAVEQFGQVQQLRPNDGRVYFNLGIALARSGKPREAVENLERALRLMPDNVILYRGLAWLLATRPIAEGGNPARALELAKRANALTAGRDLACLDILGAAYAANGLFEEALTAARTAALSADDAGQRSLAAQIRMRMQLYGEHKPYRER
jgi:tetratricopeptide (TPR) repeat protein